MKARSVRSVSPPPKLMSSPCALPLASTCTSACGSSPLAPASNGPERLASNSPPSSPSALTFSDISNSPLLTPSRLAFSMTFCGSSLLLLLLPPPQAAKMLARAASVANSAKNRIRLKRWSSSCSENRTTGDSTVTACRAVLRHQMSDEGEQAGAEPDQDDPRRDQPASARKVAKDPDGEAGEHQHDVGGDGLWQQCCQGRDEVGHGRVIIIGPCPKVQSQR